MKSIYFDNNATTSIDERVLAAMMADLQGPPGNPSSVHAFGREARQKLIAAREAAAKFFQGRPEEITFTSSGTESLDLALKSLKIPGHLITTEVEHSSVYKRVQALANQGMQVTYLPVGLWGAPEPSQIESAIRPDTQAILLSAANGETGVKIDLDATCKIAEKHGIPLILDAVAFIGKEELKMHPAITGIAMSAHKFHGPKGAGLLFHRSPFKITPQLLGGSQEYNIRAGTENLSAILGMAKAMEILKESQAQITSHIQSLRDAFEKGLQETLDIAINGEGPRICNTSNLAFLGIDGETLMIQLDLSGIMASHGSACASGALEPSRVLTKMGIDRKRARSSLRFSFSRTNTLEEVERAVDIISEIVKKLR